MLLVLVGIELRAEDGLHAKGHLVPIILNAGEHLLTGKSRDGKIQLHDGTMFKSLSSDSAKVFEEWDYHEHITFSSNPYPGGGSEFYVVNIDRGEFIHANLFSEPHDKLEHTQKVIHIDPFDGQIVLMTNKMKKQDWQVEAKDLSILNDWEAGDRVIVGMNNHWFSRFSSECEFIMVNCDKHRKTTHVRVKPY